MELLKEESVGELEGTRIKRMKEDSWHVYNWELNRDATIIKIEEDAGDFKISYYRVARWGEWLTGRVKSFSSARKFAVDYAEGRIV